MGGRYARTRGELIGSGQQLTSRAYRRQRRTSSVLVPTMSRSLWRSGWVSPRLNASQLPPACYLAHGGCFEMYGQRQVWSSIPRRPPSVERWSLTLPRCLRLQADRQRSALTLTRFTFPCRCRRRSRRRASRRWTRTRPKPFSSWRRSLERGSTTSLRRRSRRNTSVEQTRV